MRTMTMKKALALLLGLSLAGPAFADSTINSLTGGAAVSGTDIFPAYQGANPATGVTAAQIKTFANGSAVRATTTTSEAILNTDQNKLVTFSNGSAIACTIAQAGAGGNFASGWAVSLRNLGAGTVTCTPTTSTVDGAATFTLTTGQGLDLYSDGTNYFTQPGKGSTSPGGTSGQLQTNNGSGGFGAVAAPSGAVVGTTDSQTLTNKSIAASEVNSGTLAAAQMPGMTTDCVSSAGAVALTCGWQISGYVASSWYLPFNGSSNGGATSVSPTASTIYCAFGAVQQKVTIGALGVALSTASASGNIQLAIYTNVSSRPGTLLSSTANISTTTINALTAALAANKQVGPGGSDGGPGVWFCINSDASASSSKFYGNGNNAQTGQGTMIGSTTPANLLNKFVSSVLGVSCSGAACQGGSSTFNTWPADLHTSTWTDITTAITPVFMFQAASVP